MLQTKIIDDRLCAVSYEPTAIMVRERGKKHFGTEKTLAEIRDGHLFVYEEVARSFNIEIINK